MTPTKKENLSYRYSPYPLEAYRLEGCSKDETTVIHAVDSRYREATWNLFWLTNTGLDQIPGSGRNWYRVYRPVVDLLSTVVRDVTEDEVLARKLKMHPLHFADWFVTRDPASFRTYDVAGRTTWSENVEARASMAADALLIAKPITFGKDGRLQFSG